MADYKIVDAGKLDGDLTVLAEAIRQRSGTDGKLEFPDGMAETVRNIPSDGIQLPELSSPASPEDMVQGKELYDDQGNKISGSVTLLNRLLFSKYTATEDGIVSSLEADVDEDWLKLTTPPVNGFRYMLEKDAVVEAGVFLSDLGNVQPGDVVEGKTFTSAAGLKVPGTVKNGSHYFYHYNGGVNAYPEDGALVFDHTFREDCYYRAGDTIQLYHSDLGNAIAEDVAKGKTFTTAAGVKIEGTMEPGSGGGLPEGLLEYEIQTFTPEKDINEALTFSLNMEEVPTQISIATDMPDVISRSFISCDGTRPYGGLEGDSGLVMQVGVRYYTPSIVQGGATTPTNTTNRSGVWNLTNKGFTFRTNYYGGQHTYFRAGYTYTIIAMRLITHEISN